MDVIKIQRNVVFVTVNELMLQFCRVNICVCVINVVKLSKKDMITKMSYLQRKILKKEKKKKEKIARYKLFMNQENQPN